MGIEHLNYLGIREEHWEWGVYFGYVNASSDLMSFMYFRACLNKLSTRPKTGVITGGFDQTPEGGSLSRVIDTVPVG